LLSEGAHKRGVSLSRIAELVSANPARNFGLFPRKGCIAIGADADFAIVDMNLEKPIRASEALSAQDHTPFEGVMTKGWVTQTIIRGNLQYSDGKLVGEKQGVFIKRPTAIHES
jgi:dihydroorotase-like cyclic amidohydrolase